MKYYKQSNFLSTWLEINNCERLTPEEEKELPAIIQKAEKLRKKIKAENRAATQEEMEILENSEKAFNKVVESNIPLGIHFAQKYASHYPDISLTVDDLTQEAFLGIIAAAKKYDPSHACKFSTYAAYWIGQSIRRAIEDKGDLIRKPASAHSRARLVHKVDAQFNTHLDSKIVSDLTGLSQDEVEFIRMLDKTQITSIDQNFFSDEEEEQSFHEIIADDTNIKLEVDESIEKERLRRLVDQIEDEGDRIIEKLRLGFIGDKGPLTFSQISVLTGGRISPSDIEKRVNRIEKEYFIYADAIIQSEAHWI